MVGGKRQNVSKTFKDLRQKSNRRAKAKQHCTPHTQLDMSLFSKPATFNSTTTLRCDGVGFLSIWWKESASAPGPHTRKLLLPIQPILVWIPFLISRLLSTRHLLSGKWTISSLRRCKFGREKEMDGCMQFGRPKNDPPPPTLLLKDDLPKRNKKQLPVINTWTTTFFFFCPLFQLGILFRSL